MDPVTASLLISGGTAAANAIFGGNGQTDEQRKYYEWLWNEVQKPDSAFGFSAQEKAEMARVLREKISEYDQRAIGSGTTSLARRGMSSPGQVAGMTTEINAQGGKNYAAGIGNIDLASAQAGRERKAQLTSMLPYASNMPREGGDFLGTLGQFGQNLSYYMNRPKDETPDFNFQMPQQQAPAPNLGGYPSPGDYGQQRPRWRLNPQTGQWEQVNG